MDDERLYSIVVKELKSNGPIPGLWAKAFAEANGIESQAKALYLRYRVAQLALAESEAVAVREAEQLAFRTAESLREREARQAISEEQGFNPILGVLGSLIVLIVVLMLVRAFSGS
jgi:hypothetical protein